MSLTLIIILSTLSYAIFQVSTSRLANKIDILISSLTISIFGTAIIFILFMASKVSKNHATTETTTTGVWISILAGLSVGVFQILLILAFRKGNVSYVIPLIYGGSILIASGFGWLVAKEDMSLTQFAGIIAIAGGMALLALGKANTSA